MPIYSPLSSCCMYILCVHIMYTSAPSGDIGHIMVSSNYLQGHVEEYVQRDALGYSHSVCFLSFFLTCSYVGVNYCSIRGDNVDLTIVAIIHIIMLLAIHLCQCHHNMTEYQSLVQYSSIVQIRSAFIGNTHLRSQVYFNKPNNYMYMLYYSSIIVRVHIVLLFSIVVRVRMCRV